jgi:hypothetical protein
MPENLQQMSKESSVNLEATDRVEGTPHRSKFLSRIARS